MRNSFQPSIAIKNNDVAFQRVGDVFIPLSKNISKVPIADTYGNLNTSAKKLTIYNSNNNTVSTGSDNIQFFNSSNNVVRPNLENVVFINSNGITANLSNVTYINGVLFNNGTIISPGVINWGSIGGTLSSQTDLQAALDAKQDLIAVGLSSQYIQGNGNLATFPTNVSSFANNVGYLTAYTDTYVTGGTYSTGTLTIRQNNGQPNIDITGFTSGGSGSTTFTGGTVTGPTNFTAGLTANTISATTYLGLPTDIRVTGGTYTNGNAIFTNNTGGTFSVSGFAIGGGGGQLFYLNISQSKNGNRYLSTTASTAAEQSTGVTINNGVTGTIASFQSDQLGVTLIPGGVWSFYLHSYKQNSNASFDIFVEVYKLSSGGTSTLLFTTDPTTVTTNSPNPSMQLTDGYFSGTPLSITDSLVAVVRATNTSNQSHTITLISEGSQHYSYAVSTLQTQQGLTCDTLSGCSIIQTIQSDINNKLDKSGGTITNNLVIIGGLSANTFSATTYLGLPTDIYVTGGTYSNNSYTFTNNIGVPFNIDNVDTMTGLTINGSLSATTYLGLPNFNFTGGTVTGPANFTAGLTANTFSATTYLNLPQSNITTATTTNLTGFIKGDGANIFVDNSTYITPTSTNTLTNKTIIKRILSITSNPVAPSIDISLYDQIDITNQTSNITSMTTNLGGGTPTTNQLLIITFKATSGTPTITWGTSFEASGALNLPITFGSIYTIRCGFQWNNVSKWTIIAYS